jgi:hypothetical protein
VHVNHRTSDGGDIRDPQTARTTNLRVNGHNREQQGGRRVRRRMGPPTYGMIVTVSPPTCTCVQPGNLMVAGPGRGWVWRARRGSRPGSNGALAAVSTPPLVSSSTRRQPRQESAVKVRAEGTSNIAVHRPAVRC